MTTSITASVSLSVAATLSDSLDLGSVSYPLNYTYNMLLTDGTGANQAKQIWTDTRTLTASSTENIDLAGVLTNALGVTLNFTKIKAVIVTADSGNTNNVLIGGAATNTMLLFGDATDIVPVRPGGMFALTAPDAAAYAVTAATGDILKVANSSSGTSVTYTIIIIGTV